MNGVSPFLNDVRNILTNAMGSGCLRIAKVNCPSSNSRELNAFKKAEIEVFAFLQTKIQFFQKILSFDLLH